MDRAWLWSVVEIIFRIWRFLWRRLLAYAHLAINRENDFQIKDVRRVVIGTKDDRFRGMYG
ncbi:hypothetical protein ASD85_17580 [Rhizobium sp. Root651]|nr:hypothetical protein ASD85_17580 [Rhizobium sp. Root651]